MYNFSKRVFVTSIEEGATLSADVTPTGKVFFHLTLKKAFKFTKTSYTAMLREFSVILGELRKMGVKYVFAMIPLDDKLLKFEEMFGFKECQMTVNEAKEPLALILRRSV